MGLGDIGHAPQAIAASTTPRCSHTSPRLRCRSCRCASSQGWYQGHIKTQHLTDPFEADELTRHHRCLHTHLHAVIQRTPTTCTLRQVAAVVSARWQVTSGTTPPGVATVRTASPYPKLWAGCRPAAAPPTGKGQPTPHSRPNKPLLDHASESSTHITVRRDCESATACARYAPCVPRASS